MVNTAVAGFPPDVYHNDCRQSKIATTVHTFAFHNYERVRTFYILRNMQVDAPRVNLQGGGFSFPLFVFLGLVSGELSEHGHGRVGENGLGQSRYARAALKI